MIELEKHCFQDLGASRMFGLDMSMRHRLKTFDSGMFFLSFVAAMALTLPVAFLQPGLAFGKRSFEVWGNKNLEPNIIADIVQNQS